MQGFKKALRWYFKCYSEVSVTKMFKLKSVQLVYMPWSVNVFVTPHSNVWNTILKFFFFKHPVFWAHFSRIFTSGRRESPSAKRFLLFLIKSKMVDNIQNVNNSRIPKPRHQDPWTIPESQKFNAIITFPQKYSHHRNAISLRIIKKFTLL
jgi:hypothetical protein